MGNYVLPGQVQSGEIAFTGNSAPIQLANTATLPSVIAVSGTTLMANSMWYVSDGAEWVPTSPVIHGPTLNGLFHFQDSIISTRGTIGTFVRNSTANNAQTLQSLGVNEPSYVDGKFGTGLTLWEGTTNLVYNSDAETVTTTATVFSDPLTSGTVWTAVSGTFTYSSSGATSSAANAQITAGNSVWKPLLGSDGSTSLPLTAQATVTTPATLTTGNDGSVWLFESTGNEYQAYFNNTTFYLAKHVSGTGTTLTSVAYAVAAATAYTITLELDHLGNLTGKLYLGSGTGGTLEATLTATDTSLTGGFLVGVGGDAGVIATGVVVTAPWATGWTIKYDTAPGGGRVAWGLTPSAINGLYSISGIGYTGAIQSWITQQLAVTASTSYVYSYYANSVNGGTASGSYGYYNWLNSSGTIIGYGALSVIEGTTPTTRYTNILTSPSTAAYFQPEFVINDSGTFTLDALQVEAKSYATPYIQNNSTTATITRAAEAYNLPNTLASSVQGTLAFWIQPQSWSSGDGTTHVVLELFINDNDRFDLVLNDTSTLPFRWEYFNGTTAIHAGTASAEFTKNTWTHVVATWTTDSLALYANGVLVGSYAGVINAKSTDYPVILGYDASNGVNNINAALTELVFFNRVLTSSEIYTLYSAAQPLIDVYTNDSATVTGLPPSATGASNALVITDEHGNVTIANTLLFTTQGGLAHNTQISPTTTVVNTVTGSLFGIAEENVAWNLALDGSGNLGITGYLGTGPTGINISGRPRMVDVGYWLVLGESMGTNGGNALQIMGNNGGIHTGTTTTAGVFTTTNTLDDGSGNAVVAGKLTSVKGVTGTSSWGTDFDIGTYEIIGTTGAPFISWYDNSNNFGAFVAENNNSLFLGLVNRGTAAYGDLNASSFTIGLQVIANGAVYTGSNTNTAIGTNIDITVRNTLDDGAGNMDILGTFTGTTVKANNLLFAGNAQGNASPFSQGAYIGWNYTNGGGETDFMNNHGGGGNGFNFYNGTGSTWTEIMNIYGDGTLATQGTINSIAGTTGGTIYWTQERTGLYKRVMIWLVNYENDTTTSQSFTIPVGFNNFFTWNNQTGNSVLFGVSTTTYSVLGNASVSGYLCSTNTNTVTIVSADNTNIFNGPCVIEGI